MGENLHRIWLAPERRLGQSPDFPQFLKSSIASEKYESFPGLESLKLGQYVEFSEAVGEIFSQNADYSYPVSIVPTRRSVSCDAWLPQEATH